MDSRHRTFAGLWACKTHSGFHLWTDLEVCVQPMVALIRCMAQIAPWGK